MGYSEVVRLGDSRSERKLSCQQAEGYAFAADRIKCVSDW